MWKDQLRTATVNIIRWPKVRQRNRSVLDMPARPSLSPRTIPEYLARLLTLPEREIARVLLSRIRINPVNRQILKLLVRKLPVAWKLGNIKVDITLNPVPQTFLEKSGDLIDDLGNMIRSIRVQVDAIHMKILHVLEEGFRQT